MFFEVYKQGNLIIRGKQILNDISIDNELMTAPSTSITLSIDWLQVIDGREEFKIYLDECRVFWGIVWGISVNKENETIDLDVRHVITEWQYRQISVNHAISNSALNIVYMGDEVNKDDATDETITASGFSCSLTEGRVMTAEQFISRSRATAWVNSTGDRVAVVGVKIEKCTTDDNDNETCTESPITEADTYKVTFSTAKGTAVTVEVSVEEKHVPDYNVLDDPTIIDKLEDIYNDTNFAYPGWDIEFRDNTNTQMIDYVYSRQNKLDALTTTMELTWDCWWRVGLWNEKRVQIGKFGDIKPYTISTKPSGKTNIRMITEPTIDYDLENVINVATVYSDKTDGGMSSLTLREVYMNPSLQKKGFPVVILHSNVNNERDYHKYIEQYPQLAPNNEIEYAVIDEDSVALESGTIIEGTYSFNDLSPFELDSQTITDEKRVKAAQTVYESVIKRLIQSRRSYPIKVTTEPIPCDLEVGDKIRFIYANKLFMLTACGKFWKKILNMDDYFYVTAIEYNYDSEGNLTNTLTLNKWLKTERDTPNNMG